MQVVKRFWATALVGCFFSFNTSCSDDPPALPAADTMEFISFEKGNPSALLEQVGTTANIEQAVLTVGFVSLAVNLYLAVPRLIFAGVISEKPNQDGDSWIWSHTFALLGIKAELHGKGGERIQTSMHVTGLRNDTSYLDDFVWYTGDHGKTAGTWEMYDPGTAQTPGPTDPVLRIDWTRHSVNDKSLVFTNVRPTDLKDGDSLTYQLDGSIASMVIHDERSGANDDGAAEDFSVVWHLENGSGKMTRVTNELCWDTLANGQVDISCPSGDWPVP